jgi:hypothetical protein
VCMSKKLRFPGCIRFCNKLTMRKFDNFIVLSLNSIEIGTKRASITRGNNAFCVF